METLRSILASLRNGEDMASIDLSEAYLYIPICQHHQIHFTYNKHFQYYALAFGLKSSTRIFPMVLVTLVAHLRLTFSLSLVLMS